MPAADTVLIVRDVIHHLRDESGDVGAGGVREILADDAARVGEPVREFRRLGVEKQPSRLARARREHDNPCVCVAFRAGLGIDVTDTARETPTVQRDFAGHGVGDESEATSLERRSDQHIGR